MVSRNDYHPLSRVGTRVYMRTLYSIRHSFGLIMLMGAFWNCAGTPPEPAPEPVPEPEPVVVVPPSPPKSISIYSVEYDLENMTIKWNSSSESTFKSYTLLTSKGNNPSVDTLSIFTNVEDTMYIMDRFDPTLPNWFWIVVENNTGLETEGERSTHVLETMPPDRTDLLPIEFDGLLKIRWTMNQDNDFSTYQIYRSSENKMIDRVKIDQLDTRSDTLFVIPMDSIYYYQIGVRDVWGLESYSNVIKGDHPVKIWGQEYSMIGTREVDLSSMKLFGEIPPEFGLLLNLEILRLQNNFLTGPFPEALLDLKKLRSLNLSNNQFSGRIPRSIKKLISLEELWLSNNQFSGKLPYQIFMLEDLTHLNLSDNKINGYLSESISRLSKLEYLNLWDNEIIGFIPMELGDLQRLEFLSLSGNNLKGIIPRELGNAKELRSIALFGNELTGTIPEEITQLPHLEYLGLFDNKFFGEIPDHLLRSLDLTYLKLNNNYFESIDHEAMCESGYDWKNFIYYDVSKNEFDEPPICFHTSEMLEIRSSYLKK